MVWPLTLAAVEVRPPKPASVVVGLPTRAAAAAGLPTRAAVLVQRLTTYNFLEPRPVVNQQTRLTPLIKRSQVR